MTSTSGAAPALWATSIELKRNDSNLLVSGKLPLVDEHLVGAPDFVVDYRKALQTWTEKKAGKRSPHILFANADTDEKLIDFVRRYGPVNGEQVELTESEVSGNWDIASPPDLRTSIVAVQSLSRLRLERTIYKQLLTMMDELSSTQDENRLLQAIDLVAEALNDWPQQRRAEAAARRKLSISSPGWMFDDSRLEYVRRLRWSTNEARQGKSIGFRLMSIAPSECASALLQLVLNSFQVEITTFGKWVGEMPADDCRFGVRPLLYFVLRSEYLHQHAVRVCQNEKCREVFQVERLNQRFCDERCSLQQRLHDNYLHRVKPKRLKERTRKLRSLEQHLIEKST